MRQEIVELVDDVDGRPADETLEFMFEGVEYTIDLRAKNAEKFRSQMEAWIGSAQQKKPVRASRQRRTPRRAATESTSSNGSSGNGSVRDWARRKNIAVAAKGRIPASVVAAYRSEKTR